MRRRQFWLVNREQMGESSTHNLNPSACLLVAGFYCYFVFVQRDDDGADATVGRIDQFGPGQSGRSRSDQSTLGSRSRRSGLLGVSWYSTAALLCAAERGRSLCSSTVPCGILMFLGRFEICTRAGSLTHLTTSAPRGCPVVLSRSEHSGNFLDFVYYAEFCVPQPCLLEQVVKTLLIVCFTPLLFLLLF